MEWFKKHVDTVIVLTGILAQVFWMNGKFSEIHNRFDSLEKTISGIKTSLIR